MTLTILRLLTASLCLFYIGVNIAILRADHLTHVPGYFVLVLGRIGIAFGITVAVTIRAWHEFSSSVGYITTLILIPSFIFAIYGSVRYHQFETRYRRDNVNSGSENED